MRADAVIFDLDGTLWDTNATCALAWNRVLERLGVPWPTLTEDDIRPACGRTHRDAVASVLRGLDDGLIDRISAETMLEDNRMIAEVGGRLFEGVATVIPALARNHELMIVSNCQSGYIEVFRTTSGLDRYFRDHECWGNTGRSKSENLATILARNSARAPIFVGDTEGDRQAAFDNGIAFVHARYGFGQVGGAAASIDRFDELLALLQS